MRGGLAWVVAIVAGVALVVVVTAVIGTRDDEGEVVTAGEWAQSTCGAVAVWRGEMESIAESAKTSAATGAAGTETGAPSGERRVGAARAGLTRAVRATETLVTAIDNTGIPDTSGGEEAAEQVSSWANGAQNDLEQAEESLEDEPGSLEESIEQSTAAARTIAAVLTSGVQTLADVAVADPELADALRDASTCQQLREERG